MERYLAPVWLPGGNLQTIWPALMARRHHGPRPQYRRERWDTPDGDFVDVDGLAAPAGAPVRRPLLVLFHGLEGSSQSHYARAFAHWAQAQGWDYVVPHFRGCSGEMNRTLRAYHSGDHEELDWVLRRLALRHTGPMLAVGVSLGGNALLRWALEAGEAATGRVRALAAAQRLRAEAHQVQRVQEVGQRAAGAHPLLVRRHLGDRVVDAHDPGREHRSVREGHHAAAGVAFEGDDRTDRHPYRLLAVDAEHDAVEVDDAYRACEEVKKRGGKVTREAGPMKHGTTVIAFVEDPDGYKIEFIQKKPVSGAAD